MIIYKYKILYFDNKKSEKFKQQFSDDNNVFKITDLPENTIAIFCMKYNNNIKKYATDNIYFIGDKIKFQDVDRDYINLNYKKPTNQNYLMFLKYLRDNFDNLSKNNFIFKNAEKIFCFPKINSTLMPANSLFDGKLKESKIKKPTFEDNSYLDLE